MSKKIMVINFLANFLSFAISLIISFFLTPYIVKTVGAEAYGFVSLANSFVSYISLATVALNSMAGRFVTIKVHQNDMGMANKYFSSVVIANGIIASILLIPFTVMIVYIDRIINVPKYLLSDIRMLFAVIFLGFLVSIIGSLFSISFFVTNKLYLSSIRSMEGSIIRAGLIISLYALFPAKIFFIGLVSLIVQIYTVCWSIYYTNKLVPELKVKKIYFNINAIKELISSGIWNVVSKLSSILNEGLDLLVCNLFIGAGPMGVLAIAKTIPSMIMSILGVLSGVFSPELTKFYAKDKFDEMIKILNQSIKILGIFVNIPIAELIVFGDIFYTLWTPNQDAKQLQILSLLTVCALIISGSTASVYDIFTVTNKVKLNSLVTLVQGILSTIIVFVLIRKTNLGIYAVAGVSSITAIIKNLLFTFPYAAKCINQKWYVLYFPAFRTAFSVLIVSIVGIFFRMIFNIDNWFELVGVGLVTGVIGLMLNVIIILSKGEKKYLINIIKSKLG